MTTEARIPPTEITGAYGAVVKLAARKMMGHVPDSVGVLWHNKAVMKDAMGIGRKIEGWRELDRYLASHAAMASAAQPRVEGGGQVAQGLEGRAHVLGGVGVVVVQLTVKDDQDVVVVAPQLGLPEGAARAEPYRDLLTVVVDLDSEARKKAARWIEAKRLAHWQADSPTTPARRWWTG